MVQLMISLDLLLKLILSMKMNNVTTYIFLVILVKLRKALAVQFAGSRKERAL